MAILKGIIRKMTGSAGQLTFKRLNGQTIVSEKVSNVKNTRTAAPAAAKTTATAHSSRKAGERAYTHERPGNHALAFILFIRKLSDFSESP